MKVWTYKGTRGPRETGIVVKEGKFYYKFCYFYLRLRSIKNKRQKLKVKIIKTDSSVFNYFPSELCKPRHYLEADQIYIHEIFRLLKKLR